MLNCDLLLTEDILFNCADKPIKGIDGSKAVIINFNDIDRASTVVNGATITDLVLKSGKTGFAVEWYKNLASGNSAFAPNAEDIDGFTHSFLARLSASSAVNAERAKELKEGLFILVYETKYKGVNNLDAFKVAGFKNGLVLTEMVTDTNANSGSSLFTLSTQEGNVEDFPFQVFLETDYDTTKATFDTLFVQEGVEQG